MGCFGSTDTWKEQMLLTLNTLYIMSFDQENDYQGYKPLLENFTNLPSEEILAVQHNTNFVLNTLFVKKQTRGSIKCLISKARENARGSQDKITKVMGTY
jgi:hypothetical protein